ncbi:MAG TPA: hypothetical protein VIK94_03190 [Bacilli bacterium]
MSDKSNKDLEIRLEILKMPNVEQEVKLLHILEMTYYGDISLVKAKELCAECGLFSDHWIDVDAKATDIFLEQLKVYNSHFGDIEKYQS